MKALSFGQATFFVFLLLFMLYVSRFTAALLCFTVVLMFMSDGFHLFVSGSGSPLGYRSRI